MAEPMPDLDTVPRLLWELCEGHPARGQTVYAYGDGPGRMWLCHGCWRRRWIADLNAARAAP